MDLFSRSMYIVFASRIKIFSPSPNILYTVCTLTSLSMYDKREQAQLFLSSKQKNIFAEKISFGI